MLSLPMPNESSFTVGDTAGILLQVVNACFMNIIEEKNDSMVEHWQNSNI